MRNIFTRSNTTLKIGSKTVQVRKVTIAQWRELFGAIQTLPQLLISVIGAPPAERTAFIVVAIERSFDDIVRVTSLLTGLDEEYVENNASLDELVAYFAEMLKANNFPELLKNVKGALNLGNLTQVETQSAE